MKHIANTGYAVLDVDSTGIWARNPTRIQTLVLDTTHRGRGGSLMSPWNLAKSAELSLDNAGIGLKCRNGGIDGSSRSNSMY
jgi:hypothetical protein